MPATQADSQAVTKKTLTRGRMIHSANEPSDPAIGNIELFYTILQSLHECNKMEVMGIVRSQIALSDREKCLIGNFYRVMSNVETMLALKNVRHFQALAMCARSIFEVFVDIRLVDKITDAAPKMIAFSHLERLRAARRSIEFASRNPQTFPFDLDKLKSFVTGAGPGIESRTQVLWPGKDVSNIKQWSLLDLRRAAKMAGPDVEEIYESFYKELSWHAHGGVTNFLNYETDAFKAMCSQAYWLASLIYKEVIGSIAKEFRITDADPKLADKLDYANYLPLTSPDQVASLRRHFGLD